jgi:hypothetical protein
MKTNVFLDVKSHSLTLLVPKDEADQYYTLVNWDSFNSSDIDTYFIRATLYDQTIDLEFEDWLVLRGSNNLFDPTYQILLQKYGLA